MSIFRSIDISSSGLRAERVRMDVIAQNIANVDSTAAPGTAYKRREVVLLADQLKRAGGFGPPSNEGGGVRVLAIREDRSPGMLVHEPNHPAANADGYVERPNVSLPLEMVDLVAAGRAYEANASALKTGREIAKRTLDILR
ncbi:MAG: flagellar basal body rod protein FlgC [Armatimonadetes bacterium]|nr:flagellar basal body rod protein FlgC [Armatimonadota bacterium]